MIHPSRVTPQRLDALVRNSLNSSNFFDSRIVPVVPIGNAGIFVAELFHGPSGSFKVSNQCLHKCMFESKRYYLRTYSFKGN